MCAWVCRICFVPMILCGAFIAIVEPAIGAIAIVIGVIDLTSILKNNSSY